MLGLGHRTTQKEMVETPMRGFSFVLKLLLLGPPLVLAKKKSVKVVILAGEANVEGFASLHHLRDLVTGEHTLNTTTTRLDEPARYKHLYDPKRESWVTRDDVYVTYEHMHSEGWKTGRLDASWGHSKKLFGPELEMGHVLGNFFDEPIVICKAGWQKRSLAKHFRPPSAPGVTGFQWYRMQTSLDKTFNNMYSVLGNQSNYKHPQIDILGMVWWHGYSDMWAKPDADEYESNLRYFIDDVRDSLKRPDLPVVIAGIGGSGKSMTVFEQEILTAQKNVVNDTFATEFVDTQRYAVPSRPFLDTNVHYYGRADTMVGISAALADSLVSLYSLDDGLESSSVDDADLHYLLSFIQLAIGILAALAIVAYIAMTALFKTGRISRQILVRPLSVFQKVDDSDHYEDSHVPVREIALT